VRVIAVMNQKGGTGKTTTVVNLGFALAHGGLRTLLVDLDAQGNLGISFGIESERSLYHLSVTKICGQPVDQAANSSAWASAEACAGADWPYNR
jgi:chromosome partitioning protein